MKYTPEVAAIMTAQYQAGKTPTEISEFLAQYNDNTPVPYKSVVAKLSNLGVYKRKPYTTKRGEVPVKKEEYVTRIANYLGVNPETLESLEKVNKSVLVLLDKRLSE